MSNSFAPFFAGGVLLFPPFVTPPDKRTAVLTVEKATCSLCAPVVKRVLSKVPGVQSVKIVEASGDAPAVATVAYDDAVTTVAKLTSATTNAGYPSHLKGESIGHKGRAVTSSRTQKVL